MRRVAGRGRRASACRVGLLLELQRLGHGGLHAEGQLVGLDAGPQRRVVGIVDAREAIELAQQAELGRLLLAAARRPAGVTNGSGSWPPTLRRTPACSGPEVAGAVRPLAAAAVAGRRAEDDVLRQVLVERAQAVADPRADGRERAFARMPAGVPGELRAVVVVDGPQRADDGEVVGARADVLPPVADLQAALAVLLVAGVAAPMSTLRLPCDGLTPTTSLSFSGSRTSLYGVSSIDLAGVLVQLRLDVEALDVADAAAEEDPDDRLGLGREVRPAVRAAGIAARRRGRRRPEQHGAERQAGEAHAGVGEEGAAGDAGAAIDRVAWSGTSSDRHEVVVIEQHVHQVLAGAQGDVGRGLRCRRPDRRSCRPVGDCIRLEQLGLLARGTRRTRPARRRSAAA